MLSMPGEAPGLKSPALLLVTLAATLPVPKKVALFSVRLPPPLIEPGLKVLKVPLPTASVRTVGADAMLIAPVLVNDDGVVFDCVSVRSPPAMLIVPAFV